jgi:hypothetical protein
MVDDAHIYRARAVECLRQAREANSAEQRDRLAAVALTWIKLATEVDAIVRGYEGDARGERLQNTDRRPRR